MGGRGVQYTYFVGTHFRVTGSNRRVVGAIVVQHRRSRLLVALVMHSSIQGELLPRRQHDGADRRRLNDQIRSPLAGRTIRFRLFFRRLVLLCFLLIVERAEQVAKGTIIVRGLTCRILSRRHHQLHRSHARFNPKGRIHIGNQPTARNDQPIHLRIRFIRPSNTRRTRHNRSRSGSRDTRLPVNQHHPPRLALHPHRHTVDIHPRPDRPTRPIRRVPSRRMKARRTLPIHQRRNMLP